MKKISELLKEEVKQMSGNILGIGIYDSNVLDEIDKNSKIVTCNLLNKISAKSGNENGKQKTIRISKLKNKFKQKNIDYLIVNEEDIKTGLNSFIKDSIFITKGSVIFYTESDLEDISKKYSIYGLNVDKIKCSNGCILKIEVGTFKSSFITDKKYDFFNFLYEIEKVISDLL